MRRGGGIEQQIVSVNRDAGRGIHFDEPFELEPEEIEDALRQEAGRLHRRRVHANLSVGRSADRRAQVKRHGHSLDEDARLFQLVSFDFDLQLFERRIRSGEDVVVHQVREAVGGQRHTSVLDVDNVGVHVVEHRRSRSGADEAAVQVVHTHFDPFAEMKDDVTHPSCDQFGRMD